MGTMPIANPRTSHADFQNVFNSGNLAALVALYAPDAVLNPGPGPVAGREAIAEVLKNFLALKGRMELKTVFVLETGDTALTRGQWTLKGTGPDGKPVEMAGSSIEVLKRQADGTWLIVLDHPFGAN